MDSAPANHVPQDLAPMRGLDLGAPPPTPRGRGRGRGRPTIEAFLSYSREFFDSHQFTNAGPLSRALERRLAEFHGVANCVTFASDFWALVVAIKAMALPGRGEVVMPALTPRRLADPVAWAGLTPRFCEVDPETLAISPATAEPGLSENSALLLAVHPMLGCCDAAGLEGLAEAYGVPLLIDARDSCSRTYLGRKVGSFGGGEVFSLHADKVTNGFEGGYLTTNDEDLARRVYLMRGFGFNGPDNVEHLGLNAKLNEIHAAMALTSIDEFDDRIRANRRLYDHYRRGLRVIRGVRLLERDDPVSSCCDHIVVELTEQWRPSLTETIAFLNAGGAAARQYPQLQYKGTSRPTLPGRLPLSEALSERLIILPCGPSVDDVGIDTILARLGLLAPAKVEAAVGA